MLKLFNYILPLHTLKTRHARPRTMPTQQSSKASTKPTLAWLGLGTAAIALVALTAGLIIMQWQSFANLEHKYVITVSLLDILSDVENAEAREREYLVTQQRSQLEKYYSSRKDLDSEFSRLRSLAKNNPKELRAIDKLQTLVHQQMDDLQAAIFLRSAGRWEAVKSKVVTGSGKHLMDSIREDVDEIERDEQSTLAGFSHRWKSLLRIGLASLVGSALLVSCCLLIVRIVLARSAARRQQAEKELHVSEKRFEILCDQAPLGIYETDAQGRCVYTNRKWSAMSGLSASDSLGHGWVKALHPEDRERVFKEWEVASRQGTTWEYRLLTAEGETRWIRAVGGPIYSAQGTLTGYVGTLEDVTERKRAQYAIQDALQQLQLIADNMAAGVSRCSRDLRYRWISRGYAAWLGLVPEQIVGRPLFDVLGRDTYEIITPHIEKVLSGEKEECEIQIKNPAGEARWIHVVYVPTKGQDQEVDGWIALVADVTERHEAEERLRESEKRFRATFYQAAVGIAQTDIDGKWLLLNDRFCEIFGYSRDELRGKTFIDMTHVDDREATLTARRKLLAGEISSWSTEKRYIRKNGVTVWARAFVSLVRDQHNEPQYFVAAVEDITKEVQAERALQQSRQELRALTSRLINAQEEERRRISRELHDDLSQKLALLAFDTGGLVLTPSTSVEEMKEPIRNLQKRVMQLAEDVRQISHRLHPPILEDLGLGPALSELCDEFSAREGIVVEFEHDAVPRSLPLDVASCFYRVTQEALHNVSKHAQASQVQLTVSGSPEGIHLYIHDNGVGFDSEVSLPRPGLGIVSMKERVRLVQGELDIRSEPGHGTTVTVFVPLVKQPDDSVAYLALA